MWRGIYRILFPERSIVFKYFNLADNSIGISVMRPPVMLRIRVDFLIFGIIFFKLSSVTFNPTHFIVRRSHLQRDGHDTTSITWSNKEQTTQKQLCFIMSMISASLNYIQKPHKMQFIMFSISFWLLCLFSASKVKFTLFYLYLLK